VWSAAALCLAAASSSPSSRTVVLTHQAYRPRHKYVSMNRRNAGARALRRPASAPVYPSGHVRHGGGAPDRRADRRPG
jgi:hypothetical protein